MAKKQKVERKEQHENIPRTAATKKTASIQAQRRVNRQQQRLNRPPLALQSAADFRAALKKQYFEREGRKEKAIRSKQDIMQLGCVIGFIGNEAGLAGLAG